ncbi:helix-turn-helix domain-containing protein [Epilithonimonas sp.]|uniref:helix-turn-helix domain-containing protein n=1 Tax=Epilithonimonas sp. TaxID=2894511 RepID=UPI0028B0D599|nr:helix-turn-helix domain-containing protein [Epilithonimonas sp.]
MKWFAFFLFFFSWNVAQVQSDKNLLLKKANEELQYNPDKSQETATYILNNFPDKLSQSEAQFIFVKSLYYQNQLLRMFEQMTNSALPDDNNYILFSSIISSLGIKPEYYFENIKNSEIQYFEDLQTLTEARKYNDAKKIIRQLISATTIKNTPALREYWVSFLDAIPEDQIIFFKPEILKIVALYPKDKEFILESIGLLIKENKLSDADNLLKNFVSDSIKATTNVRLKRRYFDTLIKFDFSKGEKGDYIKNKENRNNLDAEIDEEIIKARSNWFALMEKNNQHKTENTIYKSRWVLAGIVLGLLSVIIIFVIRLLQQKSQYKQFEAFQKKIASFSEKKTVANTISEKAENVLLNKLDKFEISNDFLNPDLSLQMLAKKLDTNTKYLSETINNHKQKNFNAYINELRINYILIKLQNEPVYRNYKIKYLAEESGISSHSLFASIFKTVTGMSPMIYIKFLNEKEA